MHLWPSMTIRDSFKLSYLRKVEWNLHRMNSEKKSSTDQKLLDKEEGVSNGIEAVTVKPNPEIRGGALAVCREILMLLSCCYCCYCCGACFDEE